jgi:hypothetical protein
MKREVFKKMGDVAMNIIQLILLAALSCGIVAVSLRLRAGTWRE